MVNVRSFAVLFSILILVFATGVSSYAQEIIGGGGPPSPPRCNQNTQFVTTNEQGKLICKAFSDLLPSVLPDTLVSSPVGSICEGRLVLENNVLRCTAIPPVSIVSGSVGVNRKFTNCASLNGGFINSLEVLDSGDINAGCAPEDATATNFAGAKLFVGSEDGEAQPTGSEALSGGDVYAKGDVTAKGDLKGTNICDASGGNCHVIADLGATEVTINLCNDDFCFTETSLLEALTLCTRDGGEFYGDDEDEDAGEGIVFCKFPRSSCPTGWTQFAGWRNGIESTGFFNKNHSTCGSRLTLRCTSGTFPFQDVSGTTIIADATDYQDGRRVWQCS